MNKRAIPDAIDFAKFVIAQEASSTNHVPFVPMAIGYRGGTGHNRLVVTARMIDTDEDASYEEVQHEKHSTFGMMAWVMRLWGARDVLFLADSYYRQGDLDELNQDAPPFDGQMGHSMAEDPRATEALVLTHVQPDDADVYITPYHRSDQGEITFDDTEDVGKDGEGAVPFLFQRALRMTKQHVDKALASAPGGPFDVEGFFQMMANSGYLIVEFGQDGKATSMRTWMPGGGDVF